MAITPGGREGDATPLGKPGGKRRLSDYTREIAHALIRNGHPKSEAIAIARSVEKKWAVKSKNPAVRAGAVAATAEDRALGHQKRDMSWTAFDEERHKEALTFKTDHLKKAQKGLVTGYRRQLSDQPKDSKQAEGLRKALLGYKAKDADMSNTLDLDWSTFDQNRPAGQQGSTDPLSAQTHNSISAFQKAHGLPVTGQLDAHLVAWLNDPANSAAAHAAAAGAAKKAASTSTAAAKKAAALVKKTNAAKVAADKKVAAKNAADTKAGYAAQAKAIATQRAAALAASSSAASRGKSAVAAGKTNTKSLSTPMVGTNDGGRMAGKPGFGGKKAAPFVKGGGRKKVKAADAVAKARASKKKIDMANEVAKERDLDLDWASFDAERGRLGGARKVTGRPPKRKGKGEHALTPAGLKGKSVKVGKSKISQKDLFAGAQKSALARSRGRKAG